MEIKLLQKRDFGELLGVPFTFIKQEYKLLLKAIFFFAGPFFFLSIVLSSFFGIGINGTQNPDDLARLFMNNGEDVFFTFLSAIIQMAGYTMLSTVIYSYVSIYHEKGRDNFELPEVWEKTVSRVWAVLGVSFVSGFVIAIGTLIFIIPGIYLGIALCLMSFIVVHEKLSVFQAFSRSMELIKDNWWNTLGLFIVVYILVWIITLIVSLPMTLLTITQWVDLSGSGSVILFVLSLMQTLVGMVTTAVLLLLAAFIYFCYVEEKEAPSLLDRVMGMKPQEEEESTFSFSDERKDDTFNDADNNRFKP